MLDVLLYDAITIIHGLIHHNIHDTSAQLITLIYLNTHYH